MFSFPFQLLIVIFLQFHVIAYYIPSTFLLYHLKNHCEKSGNSILFRITAEPPAIIIESSSSSSSLSSKLKDTSTALYSQAFQSKKFYQSNENIHHLEKILTICRNTKPIKKKNASFRTNNNNPSHGNNQEVLSSITLYDINKAISIAGKLQRITDCIELFQSISSKFSFIPDLFTYNQMIWSYSNLGKLSEAYEYFQQIIRQQPYLSPNVYTYGALMHGVAKVKDSTNAIQLLQQMEKNQIIPNKIIFTSAMIACSDSKEYSIISYFLTKMNQYHIQPDSVMLNAMIKICCTAGKMDEAEDYFSELSKLHGLDVVTYHTLMFGHFQRGNNARVMQLYEEALRKRIQVDSGIFAIAINAAVQDQHYSKVISIAREADARRVPLTAHCYTILIRAFYEMGGIDQALSILERMKQQGIDLNEYSYSAIIAACRSRPNTVIEFLQKMKEENIPTNEVVLSAAIFALANSGSQNYTTYAYNIYLEMEANGPKPNLFTYNSLVRLFAGAGQLQEALEILNKIKLNGYTPDYHTYTSLIVACGNTNRTDVIDDIIEMMKKQNLFPDSISYSAILEANRKAKDLSKSIIILKEMFRNQIEPKSTHYNIIMRTFKESGKVTQLIHFIQKLIQRRPLVDFNANTFEIILEGLVEQNKWKEIIQIFEVMSVMFQLKPSLKICVEIIELLEKQRQYQLVFKVYRYMIQQGYDFYENRLLNDVFKRLIQVTAIGEKGSSQKEVVVTTENTTTTTTTIPAIPEIITSPIVDETDTIEKVIVNELIDLSPQFFSN